MRLLATLLLGALMLLVTTAFHPQPVLAADMSYTAPSAVSLQGSGPGPPVDLASAQMSTTSQGEINMPALEPVVSLQLVAFSGKTSDETLARLESSFPEGQMKSPDTNFLQDAYFAPLSARSIDSLNLVADSRRTSTGFNTKQSAVRTTVGLVDGIPITALLKARGEYSPQITRAVISL